MESFFRKNKERKDEQHFCPYCSSIFQTKEIMSKHVDDVHIGRGLLEGDVRNW